MKDYKRYTSKDGAILTMSQWGGNPAELELYRKLAELEDKIENGTLVFLEDRKPLIWGDEWQGTILCPHCGNDLMGGFEFDDYCETEMIQCSHCGGFVFCDRAEEYDEARVKELKGGRR